jgi:hypothetical protein
MIEQILGVVGISCFFGFSARIFLRKSIAEIRGLEGSRGLRSLK